MFLSPKKLFNYLKWRYSDAQIATLNKALGLRGKLNGIVHNVAFLCRCLSNGVAPKAIQARVRKARVYHSLEIEKAFLRDEIEKSQRRVDDARRPFVL